MLHTAHAIYVISPFTLHVVFRVINHNQSMKNSIITSFIDRTHHSCRRQQQRSATATAVHNVEHAADRPRGSKFLLQRTVCMRFGSIYT